MRYTSRTVGSLWKPHDHKNCSQLFFSESSAAMLSVTKILLQVGVVLSIVSGMKIIFENHSFIIVSCDSEI